MLNLTKMEDNLTDRDIAFMRLALEMAQQAQAIGEVPVGAVVVQNNIVVGRGFNRSITQADPTAHAEVMAMRDAARHFKNYRLPDCNLYVTLEPCMMCVGALIHARVVRLVFAAYDPKTGVCGSVMNLPKEVRLNHHMSVMGGVLAEESSLMLKQFFNERRKK